jgi:hypothetical protein
MPSVLALLLALVPATAAGEDSLCRRLGGSDAISTVVKSFLMRMRNCDARNENCSGATLLQTLVAVCCGTRQVLRRRPRSP